MKTLLMALLLLSSPVMAGEAANAAASGAPVKTGAAPSEPKKLKSAGEFGDELVKLGKGVGAGASKAGHAAADQVRREVAKGRPKLGNKPPEPVERGRSGNP